MKYLFIILLASCNFIDDYHYEVDPELEPYVEQFFIEAQARGLNIKPPYLCVRFADLGNSSGKTLSSKNPYIEIDRFFYNEMMTRTNCEREAIEMCVFHELGHAILQLGHCSYGIMADDYDNYCTMRTEFLDYLFDGSNN